MRAWGPSQWGKSFTTTPPWRLMLREEMVELIVERKTLHCPVTLFENLKVTPGIVWATVLIALPEQPPITVDGIPNADASAMQAAIVDACAKIRHREMVRQQLATFDREIQPICRWHAETIGQIKKLVESKRWLTTEQSRRWLEVKPSSAIRFRLPEIAAHVGKQKRDVQDPIEFWRSDFASTIQAINDRLVANELVDCKAFFDTVEKTPLTEEQARSVITFDNRVQVIASAGSGKTSTMVAKAGYAMHRELVPADAILMLAFNRDAAQELQRRVVERLKPLGLPAEQVVARTFHGFGLEIIGLATGEKPSLAPWLEGGEDLRHLMTLVDQLKDRDPVFRTRWDLFRVVLGRDLPAFGNDEEQPEDWDRETKATGFRTLNGEVVKSQGERLIADWLFYNGVRYHYEPSYRHRTADATHRQYRPDFYYPDADAYHEHWALDRNGIAPESFVGYAEGMAWKRALHADQGTALIETTMADLWSGAAFTHLASELTQRGIELDPNPDRQAPGRPTLRNEDLARTFRVFLTHAKSNRLSIADLRAKLADHPAGEFHYRHSLFLDLFEAIYGAWEESLRREGVIDFEDMLNLAADAVEAGHWQSPYRLVMVDEFQDASRARVRLTRALVSAPDHYLFAVGDDWQSINRFAGSDLSAMTEFEQWFGPAQVLRLERTFRCPQRICDISSTFIQKNPTQLKKRVRSETPEVDPPVRLIQVADEAQIQPAMGRLLGELNHQAETGAIETGRDGKLSVFVLGRYQRDRQFAPSQNTSYSHLRVQFSTVHGSKGLEADYVILPRLTAGTFGFPSKIEDDPVLALAMPENDAYRHAEERRLFYVALTRARRGVILLTLENRLSEFASELMADQKLKAVGIDGQETSAQPCPRAGCNGSMVKRNGRFGPFLGCSNYPRCNQTIDLPRLATGAGQARRS